MSPAHAPSAAAAPARGRPRDPEVDRRILAAALAVYEEAGWSGFTFESVARAAGVGKPGLYRRWSSREDLLFDAVDIRLPAHDLADTGTVRGDLIAMAQELLDGHVRGRSAAMDRLQVEAAVHPQLGRIHAKLVQSRRTPSRAMVLRGIDRGELRTDTPITLVLDLVAGAVANHWRNALPAERATLLAARDDYVAAAVDAALASFLR
jgi:AcrR family transcriptional regulator